MGRPQGFPGGAGGGGDRGRARTAAERAPEAPAQAPAPPLSSPWLSTGVAPTPSQVPGFGIQPSPSAPHLQPHSRRAHSMLCSPRAHTHFPNIAFIWGSPCRGSGRAWHSGYRGPGTGATGACSSGSPSLFPSSLQTQELTPCQYCARTLWKRLLPTPSPGFLCSARPEPEAPKLLVSAALLLCDCSQEKGGLFASAASVRLRRAGDAPGLMRL